MWLLLAAAGLGAWWYAKNNEARADAYFRSRDNVVQTLARVTASEIPEASEEAKYQAMLAVLAAAGHPDAVRRYATADTGRFGARERYNGRLYSTASVPTDSDLTTAHRVWNGPNLARFPSARAFTHERTPADVVKELEAAGWHVVGHFEQLDFWG